MTRKQWLLSGFVAFTCLVSTVAVAGPIENYAPVTAAAAAKSGTRQLDALSAHL